MKKYFACSLAAAWAAFGHPSSLVSPRAAEKPAGLAAPGDLRTTAQGTQIYLDEGRRLVWPADGALVLLDSQGQTLARVDLMAKVVRQSGVQAMGLEVEETDLGGSLSSRKKYLSGKKAPTGRRLGTLPEAGLPAEAGAPTRSVVQGIPITTVAYPNGASLWKFEWPDFTEEIFFDKKKSMVHNRQTRQRGSATVTLQQYADGSFVRHYRRPSGEFLITFDANDGSYRMTFANAQGETVSEWSCEDTCSEQSL